MGFDASRLLPYFSDMVSTAALRLSLALLAAAGVPPSWPSAASAFEGAAAGQETPRASGSRDYLQVPGFPPKPMPPGLRVFGPNGPISPELGGGLDHVDHPDDQRARPDQTDKKLSDADRAEALRKALAPKPSIAVIRQQTLDQLFKHLASAEDDETAKGIAGAIERIWGHSDSDTANLLMERGSASLLAGHYPLALAIFDKLVALKPQWAEAWNKRATTRFRADDIDGAMADIDQVLKLEPRHYGALAGMGLILQKSNLSKQALGVFRKALALNPRQTELRELVDKLSLEVEGRDI
jgi:tetratricopeptide (TPR) repeat protein